MKPDFEEVVPFNGEGYTFHETYMGRLFVIDDDNKTVLWSGDPKDYPKWRCDNCGFQAGGRVYELCFNETSYCRDYCSAAEYDVEE